MFQLILTDCSRHTLSSIMARHAQWYSAREVDTALSFASEPSAILHLGGRILARHLISALEGVTPREITIDRGPYGKPHVSDPQLPEIHFNISHSWPYLVVGLTRECEIGVDLENETRTINTERVATRFFSIDEQASLNSIPPAQRRYAFFRLWTLKEAMVKATGRGLSTPLDTFTIYTENGQPRLTSKMQGSHVAMGHMRLESGHHLAWALIQAKGAAAPSIKPTIQFRAL